MKENVDRVIISATTKSNKAPSNSIADEANDMTNSVTKLNEASSSSIADEENDVTNSVTKLNEASSSSLADEENDVTNSVIRFNKASPNSITEGDEKTNSALDSFIDCVFPEQGHCKSNFISPFRSNIVESEFRKEMKDGMVRLESKIERLNDRIDTLVGLVSSWCKLSPSPSPVISTSTRHRLSSMCLSSTSSLSGITNLFYTVGLESILTLIAQHSINNTFLCTQSGGGRITMSFYVSFVYKGSVDRVLQDYRRNTF